MKTTSKAGKLSLFVFSVAVLLASGARAVRAQSALDGFDPNADGVIRVVVVQPDGKVLIGGDFTTLSTPVGGTVMRNHIARLNPDGTVDATFDPNADNAVYSIALQTDGKILAGGQFTSIGGQARSRLARLDAVSGAADLFDPQPNGLVDTIVVQPDGKILIGGVFTTLFPGGVGVTRTHIARLDATTGGADSFAPNANGDVFAIALQADGKILAGGAFTGIGGQPRNRIARLNPATGAADPSFDPDANSFVLAIAVQGDGSILVGGSFTGTSSIGGKKRNYIARLNPTNGAADSFNPKADNAVMTIAVQPDGNILAGGLFTSIGGQTRNYVARLSATNGAADSFDPNCDAGVSSIAVQADGKIVAGGGFVTLTPNGGAGATRNYIARMERDGRLDQTLNLNTVGSYVLTTAVQADGKVLIGGLFNTVLGVPRNNIARLNTDGTLDLLFDPNADQRVYAIAAQPDGKILVGGDFTIIGGKSRSHLARLDATSGAADSFNPQADQSVATIAVQEDGKILVGGLFTTMGGQSRKYMARLKANGSLDTYYPSPDNTVVCIALQPDGKILVSGTFTAIGGAFRNYIARLDPTTGLADSFDPNPEEYGYVLAMAVQPDGKIVAGGRFSTMGGQARNFLARLDPTTGAPDSFDPSPSYWVFSLAVQSDGKVIAGGLFGFIGGQNRNFIARLDGTTGLADSFNPSADNLIYSIAVEADGKIFAGGPFSYIGTQFRSLFARLSNDTAALQNLAVTQNSITWTRGGSSPQLSRVVFEYSGNNSNYSFLGNGTASGSDWTLTGLNLPATQNYYIRARGYYRSGYQTGSENPTESVRVVN